MASGRRDEWRPPRPNEGDWPSLNPKTASGRDIPLQDSNSVRYIGSGGLSASNVGTAIDELALGRSFNPHDAADHDNRQRSRYISVGMVEPDTTTAAWAGTAPDRYLRINLVDGSTTGFGFAFPVPEDWSDGDFELTHYLAGLGAFGATDTFRLDVTSLEVADSASLTAAGTTVTNDYDPGVGYGAQELIITAPVNLVTPTAAGNLLRVYIRRLGGHANDDYANTVLWLGAKVSYTADM